MAKPYKKAYIIECSICHAITKFKRHSIFDPYTTDKYQTFDKNGNAIWVRADNWYTYNIDNTWSIKDETVLCPACLKTIPLAKELRTLNNESIEQLRQEMKKL